MEPLLIDTSVWITFFRGVNKAIVGAASEILKTGRGRITGLVLTELLQGAATEKDSEKILRLTSAVERIDLASQDWEDAGRLSYSLRRKGIVISTIDIVLATLAINNDCLLFTEDRHFERIAKNSDLKLYDPLGGGVSRS